MISHGWVKHNKTVSLCPVFSLLPSILPDRRKFMPIAYNKSQGTY